MYVALAAAALAFAAPYAMGTPRPVLVQAAVFVSLAACLAVHRRFRTFVSSFRPTQRALIVAAPLAVVVGHMTYAGFPLPDWHMFSAGSGDDPVYFDLNATTRSGATIRLHPGRAASSLDRLRADARLRQRLKDLPADGSAAQLPAWRRAADLIQALAKLHNQRHADDPVVYVDVDRCTVPLDDYQGERSIRRQRVGRVEVVIENIPARP